ncbi:TPA: hypothetical protein O4G03_003908 [Proteus mirabilis]|uniref:Morphogenetic protein n=1 Tax=Proteus mirabilis TaxID=584 RepID=A0A2X2BM88_PROMI|nr:MULTISPECIES: hypothetical protein [Proteus]EJG2210103.1 hypothetical protein [Proteus mirabilis]EKA98677.1 hypothetical protein HMPREF1310_01239 [Proteus mirabilis WGLW4]EKU0927210.1 hypothetical protein [Proteus mirabilis]EKU5731562.1 hypothetical protein [Proteus mirabilis]EKV4065765.1 hypothetical protein [Proteus mirabilis]
MKEYPIIFNTEMVQAILAGRKTQTRRVVKNVMPDNCLWIKKPTKIRNGTTTHVLDAPKYNLCPLGKAGDRLWVRETWQGPLVDCEKAYDLFKDPTPYQKVENCVYKADGVAVPEYIDCDDNFRQGWRPSIHMPRWASRITLEITNVRVERLQDISEQDAIAEGITNISVLSKYIFSTLWESIYGFDSWSSNPWVWVIEFKKVK